MSLKTIRRRGMLAALLVSLAGSGACRLSAKAAPHSVTVRWQAASSDKGSAPLRYNIYRSEDGGQSYICIARKVPDTSYSDTNVNGGKNYSYEVTSIDDKGHESARSAPIKVTVPN